MKVIPVGISDYRKLKENNFYVVDKSMMIHDFLKKQNEVTLITRPRRFGKTINMSMMAEFFDITKDSKEIFQDSAIMKTEYADRINSYPAIYLTFADAKNGLSNIVSVIKSRLTEEYLKYEYVFENLPPLLQPAYQFILKGLSQLDDILLLEINEAIRFLSKRLEAYYQIKVMMFIDEYDTPFIEAHVDGFYDKLHGSLSIMLSSALKNNDSLQYAMMTGIQRVAKENTVSGLNNLNVCTVADQEYAQYFGFTEAETKELLEYYGSELNDVVKDMYDGYRIGNQDIYNPWSIIKYADKKELTSYWVNTSANKMIQKAMENRDTSFDDGYEMLIKNGYVDTYVMMETSFFEQSQPASLWSLFVNAGYLTIEKKIDVYDSYVRLRIPNNEVIREFTSLTAYYLDVSETAFNDLSKSLKQKDHIGFLRNYRKILMNDSSCHDLRGENSYHVFLLGMCICLKKEYNIKSNQESGKGRADIVLQAKKAYLPSYVIEMKYTKDETEDLEALAKKAVQQIQEKKYGSQLKDEYILMGLSHCGKEVAMEWVEKKDVD